LLRIAIMSSLRPDSALFAQLKADAPIPKPAAASVALTPSSSDRARVIAGYAGVEKLIGDAARGQRQFQTLCTPCHRLRGEGNEVGPDLGMVGTKPVDWLITAILDPGQAVEARYRAWTVTLKSGDVLDGIISAETANNLVLRLAGGVEHAVLRGDIASMSPSKLSLMPTGFESALKPQDMADLLRWLRAP
jgi:putative heme-binding domain-containing protein